MITPRQEANVFASKALTDVQKGYVAIVLKLLAVAWAMEKISPFLIVV